MIRLNFRSGSAFASKKAYLYLESITPSEVNKITVIRHAAIGDFMNMRPFLIELRTYFPNARITLSVLKHYMYGIPYDLIDDVHVMSRYLENGKKSSFIQRIKEAKSLPEQDIIFDLADSTISLFLVALSRAKLKVGYPYRSIRRKFFDISILRSEYVLEAETLIHMLNIIGHKNSIPLNYGFLDKYSKRDTKVCVYFAGASVVEKCWEHEKFRYLIAKMAKEFPSYEHLILQGVGEHETFLDIYEAFKEYKNVKLQKKLDIESVMQLLANSRCLISNDTGVRNMAIALETPTVGIFFNTSPFRYWPREIKHDIVWNASYKSPSVEDAFSVTKNLLKRVYNDSKQ